MPSEINFELFQTSHPSVVNEKNRFDEQQHLDMSV